MPKAEGSPIGSPRSKLSPTAEALGRLWVGFGFVFMGSYSALTNHVYQPGDIRANQLFWVVLGVFTVAVGGVVFAAGVRMLRRTRTRT